MVLRISEYLQFARYCKIDWWTSHLFQYIIILVWVCYSYRYGVRSMHIMKECFLPFNIALALQKDSIYTERFNKKINQLIEGGFIEKWLFDEFDRTAKKADIKVSSKAEPLNIDNIQVMQWQSIWITILYCYYSNY